MFAQITPSEIFWGAAHCFAGLLHVMLNVCVALCLSVVKDGQDTWMGRDVAYLHMPTGPCGSLPLSGLVQPRP